MEKFLTIDEVKQYGIGNKSTIAKLIATGELRSVKCGRLRRIPESFLKEYQERLKDEATSTTDQGR